MGGEWIMLDMTQLELLNLLQKQLLGEQKLHQLLVETDSLLKKNDRRRVRIGLQQAKRLIHLEKYYPDTLFQDLSLSSEDLYLTKANFYSFFQKVNPDKKNTSYLELLRIIWGVFRERMGESEINIIDLICGLSILCQGSKRRRVGDIFQILGDGESISIQQLERYLTAVFQILDITTSDYDLLLTSPQQLTEATLQTYFQKESVSFEEFMDWIGD